MFTNNFKNILLWCFSFIYFKCYLFDVVTMLSLEQQCEKKKTFVTWTSYENWNLSRVFVNSISDNNDIVFMYLILKMIRWLYSFYRRTFSLLFLPLNSIYVSLLKKRHLHYLMVRTYLCDICFSFKVPKSTYYVIMITLHISLKFRYVYFWLDH